MPRRSRLEPHRDLLGKVPDQVLAERASVTVANVRAYRYRHGIKLDKVAAMTTRANLRTEQSALWAFCLTLAWQGEKIETVTTGRDIVEVAESSVASLRQRYPGAAVRRIVALAPVVA